MHVPLALIKRKIKLFRSAVFGGLQAFSLKVLLFLDMLQLQKAAIASSHKVLPINIAACFVAFGFRNDYNSVRIAF